jgi:hypothetical protein
LKSDDKVGDRIALIIIGDRRALVMQASEKYHLQEDDGRKMTEHERADRERIV